MELFDGSLTVGRMHLRTFLQLSDPLRLFHFVLKLLLGVLTGLLDLVQLLHDTLEVGLLFVPSYPLCPVQVDLDIVTFVYL